MEKQMNNKSYDVPLIVISLFIVSVIVVFLGLLPEKGTAFANKVFVFLTNLFGAPILLFTFGVVAFLVYISFSKYGDIRLGKEKPQFSTKSWIAMMLTAGLGSATVYWAFTEWAFYYNTPGLGAEPQTSAAYEWALAYNFFHWGISAWALYCIAALPIAYHFYVRKNKGLSLSSVVGEVTGFKSNGVVGKIVDIIFIFTCLGGLSITLGLSVPLLSQGMASILGIETSFTIDLIIILIISVVFTLSAYLGIEKGVKRITDLNSVFVLGFIGLIFLIGPTTFMINNSTNAVGLMVQNFVHMSLWTDPIENGSFPNDWTIFYWLYWITYAPFMGVFVTRISRGRKIKELIFNMLISGSLGCWIFFGILQNISMDRDIRGIVDVSGSLDVDGGNQAIIDVLNTLPLSTFFILFFVVVSMLFLASTLDSASYTLAATATKGLKDHEDPSPFHRLFWCLVIVLVPLTIIFINAPMNTIKTAAIVTSIPLIFVLLIMIYGLVKWMREDFGDTSAHVIKEKNKRKKAS
ncbi:BCCT family transporter [Halobacillus shinanisalinarum]|uniref:BCCT family transporter n=1 Tax=Halobacillus shinanisalinarum TaxID=2932258 RepID=A0ABY4H422_9BACI|nr:BCCT family transporter [Halobacillus shinanisalinarum]UOQ95109.1 BCCT family transporter [Halobacillus shinanisalinarum]